MPAPADLCAHVAADGVLESWNVGFERWIWELYCVPVLGWPVMEEHQWLCAMAKARAFALPGALGKAGPVVGADTLKDSEGARLMKLLSMPHQPTASDPRPVVRPIYTQADYAARVNELIMMEAMK